MWVVRDRLRLKAVTLALPGVLSRCGTSVKLAVLLKDTQLTTYGVETALHDFGLSTITLSKNGIFTLVKQKSYKVMPKSYLRRFRLKSDFQCSTIA